MIGALHPVGAAPFSIEAFSCQKAGNARSEYEDAWAIRGSDSPTRCRVAVADKPDRRPVRVRLELLEIGDKQDHLDELVEPLSALRRYGYQRDLAGLPVRIDCGTGDPFYRATQEYVDGFPDAQHPSVHYQPLVRL